MCKVLDNNAETLYFAQAQLTWARGLGHTASDWQSPSFTSWGTETLDSASSAAGDLPVVQVAVINPQLSV
jgi:hypothetical protein